MPAECGVSVSFDINCDLGTVRGAAEARIPLLMTPGLHISGGAVPVFAGAR